MKKSILLILLFAVAGVSYGQNKGAAPAASSGNCFKDWYTLFRDRGADPVPDGTNDVIITLRNGEFSNCFMGKVETKGGAMVGKLQIQKLDGTGALCPVTQLVHLIPIGAGILSKDKGVKKMARLCGLRCFENP